MRGTTTAGGSFAHDEMTALGMALVFDIAPEGERAAAGGAAGPGSSATTDTSRISAFSAAAPFRARWPMPGFVETAFRLFMQPEYPGWIHWLRQGATTLWGNWHGEASRNHIMFGDVSAWCFRYLGGLVPDEAHPGFSSVTLRPHPGSAARLVPHVPRHAARPDLGRLAPGGRNVSVQRLGSGRNRASSGA